VRIAKDVEIDFHNRHLAESHERPAVGHYDNALHAAASVGHEPIIHLLINGQEKMEETVNGRVNLDDSDPIAKEQQSSFDHSREVDEAEDDSDCRILSTVSDDGSFEILDFEDTEAGVKTCAPGKKRKTSADGPGFVTSGKTSDFSNEFPDGGDGERDLDEYPSHGGGDGNKSGQHWHPREPDSQPKRFACPYYKNDHRIYQRCATWSNPDLHRMKYYPCPVFRAAALMYFLELMFYENICCPNNALDAAIDMGRLDRYFPILGKLIAPNPPLNQ